MSICLAEDNVSIVDVVGLNNDEFEVEFSQVPSIVNCDL